MFLPAEGFGYFAGSPSGKPLPRCGGWIDSERGHAQGNQTKALFALRPVATLPSEFWCPGSACSEEGVDEDDELTHGGGEGKFCGLYLAKWEAVP